MPIPATIAPLPLTAPVEVKPVAVKGAITEWSTSSLQTLPTTDRTRPKRKIPSLISRTENDVWVDISDRRLPNDRLGGLYSGSQFEGVQTCGKNSYQVKVNIQHVNLKESVLSGYLNIVGLTEDYPDLTTFFEGEIIGPKYSFLTRKWQANHAVDVSHWQKFPSFQPFMNAFNQDGFTYDPSDQDFIYMRWKERFLVPDHRVDNIDGASFAGFYYICYQRSTNTINGFYYFRNHTDWYQKLCLEHVEQRSFAHFEFR
ncbi:vacuolar import and degradation protein-domain-containing protein [Radiomyces spectabilis]|uniref:vacuolar import and degradation protein-domain-containing protein n=1 Tax=Radiomyces spectabilis TaxID=64574 RepID=UPI00222114DB|nr:vacuolar import and degradation protein-domain-containing protein [Radiomyces spectabilis]KAI8365264.1 vacuolar import and degradation protein-domain-containing protein [Radiomyces spectabilis]